MIPHWLTNPQLGNGSVDGQILNRSWEILPVERNFKKPLWFTHCCLTRASLYPHITETKRYFRTAETHKRYDYNSLHVQSQSFATEQWQSAANQVQSLQRWVEPNQRSVPNQCSNIRSFSGTSLPAQAKFDRPRHPKPRVLARRDFYFKSARAVIVTHSSQISKWKRECRSPWLPGLPDFLFWRQISQIWHFFRDNWYQKIVRFFSILDFFWRQLAHAIRLVSSLLKYFAEKCY